MATRGRTTTPAPKQAHHQRQLQQRQASHPARQVPTPPLPRPAPPPVPKKDVKKEQKIEEEDPFELKPYEWKGLIGVLVAWTIMMLSFSVPLWNACCPCCGPGISPPPELATVEGCEEACCLCFNPVLWPYHWWTSPTTGISMLARFPYLLYWTALVYLLLTVAERVSTPVARGGGVPSGMKEREQGS